MTKYYYSKNIIYLYYMIIYIIVISTFYLIICIQNITCVSVFGTHVRIWTHSVIIRTPYIPLYLYTIYH